MKTFVARRRILVAFTLGLLGVPLLSDSALAQTALRPIPPILATVSDETDTLNPSQGRAVMEKLSEIEDRTAAKIIVLIAVTVHPETAPSPYAA